MRPDSGGADLLLAAREALLAEVLPSLAGTQRYAALMVANALGMVERELTVNGRLCAADHAVAALGTTGELAGEEPTRALCRAIRAGRRDADGGLHDALYARAIAAVAITRPDALTPAERRRGRSRATTTEPAHEPET